MLAGFTIPGFTLILTQHILLTSHEAILLMR